MPTPTPPVTAATAATAATVPLGDLNVVARAVADALHNGAYNQLPVESQHQITGALLAIMLVLNAPPEPQAGPPSQAEARHDEATEAVLVRQGKMTEELARLRMCDVIRQLWHLYNGGTDLQLADLDVERPEILNTVLRLTAVYAGEPISDDAVRGFLHPEESP